MYDISNKDKCYGEKWGIRVIIDLDSQERTQRHSDILMDTW